MTLSVRPFKFCFVSLPRHIVWQDHYQISFLLVSADVGTNCNWCQDASLGHMSPVMNEFDIETAFILWRGKKKYLGGQKVFYDNFTDIKVLQCSVLNKHSQITFLLSVVTHCSPLFSFAAPRTRNYVNLFTFMTLYAFYSFSGCLRTLSLSKAIINLNACSTYNWIRFCSLLHFRVFQDFKTW